MKMNIGAFAVLACIVGLFSVGRAFGQEGQSPKKGDEVIVLEFKDLQYPALARSTRTQGPVVVRVKLSDDGAVEDAAAVSGSPLLVPSSLNNIRKWHFRPNARKSAVIVYNFIFVEGRCESHGSLFVLQPSNLATVIGCEPATEQ